MSLPADPGVSPTGGLIVSIVGTNTNSSTIINSQDPPPPPASNQVIVAATNVVTIVTTNYPLNQIILSTNYTVVITGTNRTVIMTSSNPVCGTTYYTSNSLPTNVCSYTLLGPGPYQHYSYTLIVGTNLTYSTNLSYIYGTNISYTYQQLVYTFTIYTSSPIYQTNSYDHILCGDGYVTDSLGGNTYVSCPSRVVLTNGFQMWGADQIVIAPGASLLLYVGGGDCGIKTQAVLNQSGFPTNFVVNCANDVTNLELDGFQTFAGVVVAPNSHAVINTAGLSSTLDFSGFMMVNSLVVNGNLNFHYDESLKRYASPPTAVYPRQIAGGAFAFHVGGVSGISYVIQASTNLMDWFPVATNVGPFSFTETNTAAADRKFYRVLWQ